MRHHDSRFSVDGKYSNYCQYWLPECDSRAVMLLVHGAGEHSSRYRDLAGYFCAHGFAVAALDHIGHGRSDGRRGHLYGFGDLLLPLDSFRRQVERDLPGLPLVLLGHSMGGLVCAAYLLQCGGDGIAGCVLSGPAVALDPTPGALQVAALRLLARLWPTVGVLQLDAAAVSRDPVVVGAYRDDPLVHHGRFSARFTCELLRIMRQVRQEAGNIDVPLLLMHGEADSLTAPAGSRLLYANAGATDKTLQLYPGLYHEIFREPEREQVLADLLDWCERHCAVS